MKRLYILTMLSFVSIIAIAQQRTDTIKCYVQIMIPAANTVGMSRNIEDNILFLNGGIFLYTKAYAIKDTTGKYVKFLNHRRKELKDIWMPDSGPVVMRKEW